MKRHANLFDSIISIENLQRADNNAQVGKYASYGVIQHNKNREQNILQLHESLKNGSYKTSQYDIFKIYEPKERTVYRLPYYPDRIVHHAIMLKLEHIFVSTFTADTYSCIKGRGIHKLVNNLKHDLNDVENTLYCLKIDIKKFYPNINHEILKQLLRKKIKDNQLLSLLDEIIDSADGVPIGNYLSQYFANFYLSYFDHWIKEAMQVKYYYRYCDDMIILSANKQELHKLLHQIKERLQINLKLEIKDNYQIFPVHKRGIDFVGYVFFHTHTLLRKSIKKNFARKVAKNKQHKSIPSYTGWAKHCNSKNLLKKLLHNEKI